MSKGRPSGGSGTGGGMHVAAPRFVRVKKRAMVTEEACGKEGETVKVGDKRAAVAFVRKSTAVLLEEAGGSQDKDFSLISSSKTDAHTTAGGKRRLPASQQGEGGALEGKVAKRMKLEEDMPVRNSCKGRRKRRKRGQKVVAAPAKKDHLEEALSYLRAWHNQRETWSFKKKMQVCLLEHMYDSSKVTHTRACSQGMHMRAHTHTTHVHILLYTCTVLFLFRLASRSLQPFSSTWKAYRGRAEQQRCRGPSRLWRTMTVSTMVVCKGRSPEKLKTRMVRPQCSALCCTQTPLLPLSQQGTPEDSTREQWRSSEY